MGTTTSNLDYAPELGSILSKEQQKHLSAGLAVGMSVLLGIGLAAGLYYFTGHLMGASLLGFAIGGLGAAVAITSAWSGESGSRSLYLHENGVRLERNGHVQTMLFEEMESFDYGRTRIYVNGTHIGDCIETKLVARTMGQVGPNSIVFTTSTKKEAPPEFDYSLLLEMVSEQLGLKLAAELAEQDKVEWVSGSFIRKDGVEVPIKSLVKSTTQFVPWSDIVDYQLHDGKMLMAIDDSGKWRVKLDTSKTNFYPGLALFQKMHGLSISETELPAEMANV